MIYFDHNAATPLCQQARAAIERGLRLDGNPASPHAAGQLVRRVLDEARTAVAACLGAAPADVVFTSGGTEACNLGVFGIGHGVRRVVTTEVEHSAVGRAVDELETRGLEVIRLAVPDGVAPTADEVASHVRPGETLVALQAVNHETGTVFPVESYGEAVQRAGGRLFVDACQALGKIPIRWAALGADGLALAAQKIGGPAGAGALVVRRGQGVRPRQVGGAQESGRRAGTPTVALFAGLGAACQVLDRRLGDQARLRLLRDQLEAHLRSLGALVNGAGGARVASVSCVSVPGWRGEDLVAALDVEGLSASAGAACSSGIVDVSPVVRAMYPNASWRAGGTLRLSLGSETTDGEIPDACAVLSNVITRRGSAA